MTFPPVIKKYITPILVALFATVIIGLYFAKPQPNRHSSTPEARILVDTVVIAEQSLTPVIESYGVVEPLTKTQLVAQVSGRVIEVAEAFRDGGFFDQNDVLMRIDPADYKIEVAIARAALAEARRNLQEQSALAEQARVDWQRLGDSQQPSPLTLREPQVASAKASVASAAAGVERAELNLQRTEIRAPYAGRVLSKQADLGQVVGPNTVLGSIYATNAVEIRLPIKNQELSMLALPERYRDSDPNAIALPEVTIISQLAGREEWSGKIVRTASSVDENSRQLYVVARIDDPFGAKAEGRFPLKIGQYITAKIQGKAIPNVLLIPVNSLYQGSYVYLYREGAVYRQEVELAWQNSQSAMVAKGLQAGDQLVLSPLGQVNSGTKVKISGDVPEEGQAGREGVGKGEGRAR